METKIDLNFDRSLVALAGNRFGKKTYEKQVRGKLDISSGKIIIHFPDNIEKVASSFVQGFFTEWLTLYGLDAVRDRIIIESVHNPDFAVDVMNKLI